MSFIRLFFITISFTLFGIKSFTQTSTLFENPPFSLLVKMTKDTNSLYFEKKYGITKDSLGKLFEKFGLERYYIGTDDISYFYDALRVFRKKPGDCGWLPGTIMYRYMPGKEKEAKKYIILHNYKVNAFTKNDFKDSSSEDFKLMEIAINNSYYYFQGGKNDFYYALAIKVGAMQEEKIIKEMQKSGLFLYVSRDAIPCGSYYSRILVKKKYVFGNQKPESISGTKFLTSFFKAQLIPKCTINVVPTSDFTYNVTIIGLSKYFALKKNNLWEKFEFTILFQNGFDCAPDEIEIMIQYNSFTFARGLENAIPPLVRFSESSSEDFYDSKNQASSFAQETFNAMASKCQGKYLSSTSFNH